MANSIGSVHGIYYFILLSGMRFEITFSNNFSRLTKRCEARAISVVGSANHPRIMGTHAHGADGRLLDSAIVRNWLKRTAKDQPALDPRAIAVEALNKAKATTAPILPTQQNLARSARRSRGAQGLTIPISLAELQLPDIYRKTNDGTNFVLFDEPLYNEDENRLIIFGTDENLKLLSECDSVYADGTFDLSPPLFQQLYSIHGEKNNEKISSIFRYVNEWAFVFEF